MKLLIFSNFGSRVIISFTYLGEGRENNANQIEDIITLIITILIIIVMIMIAIIILIILIIILIIMVIITIVYSNNILGKHLTA